MKLAARFVDPGVGAGPPLDWRLGSLVCPRLLMQWLGEPGLVAPWRAEVPAPPAPSPGPPPVEVPPPPGPDVQPPEVQDPPAPDATPPVREPPGMPPPMAMG